MKNGNLHLSVFSGLTAEFKGQHQILPVLEVLQLRVDLLNVEVGPQDVEVPADAVDDGVVQTVELGEQRELLPDSLQLRILCK